MKFNSVLVLGAGAIGSVYGALLSRSNDVTLIGSKAHMDAVNSRGLLISGDVNETFHLETETKIREVLEKTLIILTTKAYDSKRAIKRISELLRKDTVILVLQNGLGNEEIVKKVVGNRVKVLRGITTAAAEFLKPGEIDFWNGETIIEQNTVAETIAETLNECALKTTLTGNIVDRVWNKVVVNCVVNPLTALLRVRNCNIAADSLKPVRHRIIRECVSVGRNVGIVFPANLETEVDREISHYTNFSSMYQDIMKGKKTEIDFLNGKIVELGRKNHVPTPVNETLVCLIKFLESRKNGLRGKD